jgi:hypothetical protein
MAEPDSRLTDEDAQKVIARALELEAQSADALTVTQIREIAAELSIPASAVDQALSEYHAAGTARPPSTRAAAATADATRSDRRVRSRLMVAAAGALAVVGGAFVLAIVRSVMSR